MLETKNGKVFVDGSECNNAELIGLALLDSAENGVEIKIE